MTSRSIKPPLRGMTVVPDGYGTDFWRVCGAAAWFGLLEWAMSQRKFRDAFERETKIQLSGLPRESQLGRFVHDASGRDNATMAAWCDWVTMNYWGVTPEWNPITDHDIQEPPDMEVKR